MIHPATKWTFPDPVDPNQEQALAEQLQLHPLVAKLLLQRGMTTVSQAQRFLQPEAQHSYDPMQMYGMQKAVDRIKQAVSNEEYIRIYGDYDADGVCSTALMHFVMQELGANFDTYIPHRSKEGYGLNITALDAAKKQGVSLIVTVDNGVSAVEQIDYASQMGIDVVVTDHHEPPEMLPQACALVNPKLPACTYPFSGLAGVGVAFKLAQALLGRFPEELTELVAIGTIADLMPLVDENRLLVKLGLARMQTSSFPGIRRLLHLSGADQGEVTSKHIAYAIGPRINASGRLGSAVHALECLIASDEQQAEQCAKTLEQLNKDRQALVEETTAEAMQQIEQNGMEHDNVLLVAKAGWNIGVVGIVAAKLLETFDRPVVVLAIDEDKGLAKGSARSIPGFDLHGALTKCADLLEHYGGHQAAAGMTLKQALIGDLRNRLCDLAGSFIAANIMPETLVDIQCEVDDIDLALIEQLQLLSPFGIGNEAPRIMLKSPYIQDLCLLGKNKQHLKLLLQSDNTDRTDRQQALEALAFGKGDWIFDIAPTSRPCVLGALSINEWNGRRRPQIIVEDVRISHIQVFDWRGKIPHEKTKEWLSRQTTLATHERAIVVFHPDHLYEVEDLLKKTGSDVSIWTVSTAERELTVLSGRPTRSWIHVKDMLVYSLPNEIWKLQTFLFAGVALERIHMLCKHSYVSRSLPSRDQFRQVYGHFIHCSKWKENDKKFFDVIGQKTKMSAETVQWMIDVFEELGFLQRADGFMHCVSNPQKKPLTSSKRYTAALIDENCEQKLLYSTSRELCHWLQVQASRRTAQDVNEMQKMMVQP